MVAVTERMVKTCRRDSVGLVRGFRADRVDGLRDGIRRNLERPGHPAAENMHAAEAGRFFADNCNWTRSPECERGIGNSDAARVAATLMGSGRVQMFHDHVLLKKPWTMRPSPRHQVLDPAA